MDSRLARYLDGDLADAEAMEFLDAVDSNPALEAELRAHEQLMAAASELPGPARSAPFVDAVMREVRATHGRERRRDASVWYRRWAMAASLALVFLGGYWFAQHDATGSTADPAIGDVAPAGLRMARLVYVPTGEMPDRVTVAGSFNAWNPVQMPMQRRGGAFTASLLLPPGDYEYMFVEDGSNWVTDPLAPRTRDDGFGGRNAVLDLRS